MFGELYERAAHSAAGGGGEKAAWGEPLVYIAFMIGASALSWNGGLLGAVAAAIAGFTLSRLRPESSQIGLGATAAAALVVGAVAFAQFGPFSFRLVEVTSRAEPAQYSGPCPTTVKVIGRITVAGGAGEVNYQFMGPTMTPDAKLVFDAPGTREVSATWTVGDAGKPQQKLERWRLFVREPKRIRQLSSDASISIQCTPPAQSAPITQSSAVEPLAPPPATSEPAPSTATFGQQPSLSAGFRVAEVILTAEPAVYVGPCPVTIKFTGKISTAGGKGKVIYKFLRSDGASGPTETLVFDSPGSKDVGTTWKLGTPLYAGWQSIHVIEPLETDSGQAHFTMQCR